MKAAVLSSTLGLVVFAGCATVRKPPPSAPPALPVVRLTVTPPSTPSGKTSPIPEQMMLVESIPSGAIIVVDGRPVLGTWQGVYLWEHRTAPHRREVVLHPIRAP